jgi:hypothetical protein
MHPHKYMTVSLSILCWVRSWKYKAKDISVRHQFRDIHDDDCSNCDFLPCDMVILYVDMDVSGDHVVSISEFKYEVGYRLVFRDVGIHL